MSSPRLIVAFLIVAVLLVAAIPKRRDSNNNNNNISHDETQSHRRLWGWEVDNEKFVEQTLHSHLPMFQVSDHIVMGPSVFPKPTAIAAQSPDDEIVAYITPSIGKHREDQDAVMIFASEYSLDTYILFISTLRATGFEGDVVMAISNLDYQKKDIKEYLEHDPHVVVYVLELTCFNAEKLAVDSMKGGTRVCKSDNLFGRKQNGMVTPIADPRPPRTGQTLRYELYWIWSTKYSKHSWLMLIDARDTIFQTNPFLQVPREKNPDRDDGVLLFFGENIEATRLGLSAKNRKWLTNSYGEVVADIMKEKPTICSGSTMGEQVALETYLRAMVGESDETLVTLKGADQGFHNYLYYSNKLGNAKTIRSIVVQDQGSAIVNNIGAMRTKELGEWGNGKLIETTEVDGKTTEIRVLNWDGELSPLVHQFDRHKVLSNFWYKKKTSEYRKKWREVQNKK